MCGFLIKSAWRYVKISAHLLQFLCHITSDVKFSQVFFFFLIYIVVQRLYEVKELWLLNKYRSFQKQSFTDFHRRPATLLKRYSNTGVNFAKYLRTLFSQNLSDGCVCFLWNIKVKTTKYIYINIFTGKHQWWRPFF